MYDKILKSNIKGKIKQAVKGINISILKIMRDSHTSEVQPETRPRAYYKYVKS